jgi:predicted transglutaminase-like cysteine proteinase
MLRYGAAACFAAFILGWPAYAGNDTDTFWSTPSAAVLASATVALAAPELAPAHLEPTPPPVAATLQAITTPVAADLSDQPAPAPHYDRHLIIENDTASIGPVEPDIAPVAPTPPVALPFGLAVAPVSFGQVVTKWTSVEAKIRADDVVLAHCDADPQHCPQAARNFLAIVAQGRARSGLARIGTINRAVNLAIEPMSDMAQWGVVDRWSNPLETFTTGRGDCEDYAIAKYVALTAAGMPAQDVKLVIVRNTAAAEDHAVVAVRNDDHWIILDNRWLTMVEDVAMAKAVPLFVLDDDGVRAFAAPVLTVARGAAAPASIPF